jgi:hypothetical protein
MVLFREEDTDDVSGGGAGVNMNKSFYLFKSS